MVERTLRKKLLIGAAAVAALAGGGAAVAASEFGSDVDEQAIIDDAAKRLGVEPNRLSNALEQAYADRIDQAVEDGRLTEEQGQAMKKRLENEGLPFLGGHGPGFGDHGHGFGGHHVFGGLDAAATYLGLTEEELRDRLHDGTTLADVAKDEDKSVDGLEQAIVDGAKKNLDALVADGDLTQAEADRILAGLQEHVDDLVNRTLPPRQEHHDGKFEAESAA